jgi:hypothetical protein
MTTASVLSGSSLPPRSGNAGIVACQYGRRS